MIKFQCKNCGEKFSVPEINAGKKGKCPKCKNIILIPQIQDTSSLATPGKAPDKETAPKDSPHDLTLLEVPQKDKTQGQSTVQEYKEELEEEPKIDQPEPVPKRKLPWIIDIFLYPVSVSGIIHLAIFLFLPPLFWFLLNRLSLNIFFMLFLCAGFFLLSLGYMFYYLAYCVLDSAKGGRRAPDISLQDVPDKGDLISQVLLILGCVAICFWPAALYCVLTEKIDLTFWLLSACGTFFFPMALLAGVMFDSFNALNPILIVGSIFKTFLPYCGLLLFFYGLGGLVAIIITNLANLPKTQTIEGLFGLIFRFLNCLFTVTLAYPGMALIYLSMVASRLLGSFYRQHKKKLNWGI